MDAAVAKKPQSPICHEQMDNISMALHRQKELIHKLKCIVNRLKSSPEKESDTKSEANHEPDLVTILQNRLNFLQNNNDELNYLIGRLEEIV